MQALTKSCLLALTLSLTPAIADPALELAELEASMNAE